MIIYKISGRVDGVEIVVPPGFTIGIEPRLLKHNDIVDRGVGIVKDKVLDSGRFVSILLPDLKGVRRCGFDWVVTHWERDEWLATLMGEEEAGQGEGGKMRGGEEAGGGIFG
jgi:hypothetical protein